MNIEPRKFKVLCLHGYRQNSLLFNSKVGGLKKKLKKYLDLFICDAPHLIDLSNPEQRAWWFNSEGQFSSKTISKEAIGFQESINYIQTQFDEHGPFDGIVGFSQGASLTGLICSLKELKLINLEFKFAIIFSGFKSLILEHEKYYQIPITVPSLHIFGCTDNVVDQEISKKHADCFVNAVIKTHPLGHMVPNSGDIKESVIDFLNKQE